MIAMIANISAMTLAAINLANPLLCKLENFTLIMAGAASVTYKSSMSLLASYLAALIATAKSQKAAHSLSKIVKIGVLVKVVMTIVTHAASLEVTESNVQMLGKGVSTVKCQPNCRFSSVQCVQCTLYMGYDLWVLVSLSDRGFADLTDVTLADEDTNSIPTDYANKTITGNMAMLVAPKFISYENGTTRWSTFQLMQIAPPCDKISN